METTYHTGLPAPLDWARDFASRRPTSMSWNPNDPLTKYGRPLAAVLIAVFISVLIAAMIGGALPFEYQGRALAYTVLVVYIVAGAVVVFRLTCEGERQPLNAARIVKWTLTLWLWPLLLLRGRGAAPGK
jgi:membrane protease YdiL (CAAX protease family)